MVVVAGLVARGGTETAAFPHTNGDDATFEEKELASEGALKARVMDTAAIASTKLDGPDLCDQGGDVPGCDKRALVRMAMTEFLLRNDSEGLKLSDCVEA